MTERTANAGKKRDGEDGERRERPDEGEDKGMRSGAPAQDVRRRRLGGRMARKSRKCARKKQEDALFARISTHVMQHVGPIANVFHWPGPDIVHLDVLHVPPTPRRRCHTLVTCGMSLRPMCPPPLAADLRHAELYLSLPENWRLNPAQRRDSDFWPVSQLSEIALYPHLCETWLWCGHTITDAGDTPIGPGVPFTGWLIGPHLSLGHEGCVVRFRERVIYIHSALPLYAEELRLAQTRGSESLFSRLAAHGVTDVVDLQRPNTVAGR
ncbi:MAG: suppressor of fused domain protein [Candidatus Eisenbacteria bacterium]|nr:suppressor of fused domain protein [Candidatus Eisenbacteria bacterium]